MTKTAGCPEMLIGLLMRGIFPTFAILFLAIFNFLYLLYFFKWFLFFIFFISTVKMMQILIVVTLHESWLRHTYVFQRNRSKFRIWWIGWGGPCWQNKATDWRNELITESCKIQTDGRTISCLESGLIYHRPSLTPPAWLRAETFNLMSESTRGSGHNCSPKSKEMYFLLYHIIIVSNSLELGNIKFILF